ncbi:hypothetical protein PVAND_012794 [Polypedilum vanderplanki]|uniref:Molybdenum cofactor sulfurase n=1 Tax=Polypedilum vanderplanki TaxID=319348 RepID=A0A9J6CNJ0_POLVA|nr:hypothetical protein PVAND_012794 [Polypedilum vanderplanki]
MDFINEFNEKEIEKIKSDFTRLKDTTYLDTTGAALYGESQMREVCQVLTSNLISSPHTSKATGNIIDQVRYRVLKHFNADPDEYSIIFTSGCTAALKIVGECFQFGDNGAFYYLTDSHTSVLGLREIVQTDKIIPVSETMLSVINMMHGGTSLLVFPAQCNYNGQKYSLDIIKKVHENPNMFVLLDAAAFVSTNKLDLSIYKPNYVALSFYKIFGTPTGLGALIISKRGAENLNKKYYGGGTVKIALTRENWHEKRDGISEKFEDGTPNFQGILSLHTSFKYFENLLGDEFIERISRHVFNLGKYFYHYMKSFKHYNQQPVTIFYHNSDFDDIQTQGGVVTFNLKRPDGSFVGFAEFASIAALHNIIIRTGCFCNPGACQTHLKLTNKDLKKHFDAGHVCGDLNDLVDGIPTGCIRVSFGYMNTKEDVDKLLKIVESCYVQKVENFEIDKPKEILNGESKAILKSIRIYPIKSCGAMKIDTEWPLSRTGLKYDREWMIMNGNNGTSLTQKNEPKMCMIWPYIDESKNTLRLDFPHSNSIEVLLNDNKTGGKQLEASICETKVCGDRINGIDCGDEVAKWLSDVLMMENLRLIRQINQNERKNGKEIALANQAQFLLISEASVQWLMNQVESWDNDEKNMENVIDRFRGNFIIENLEALAENNWKCLKIGDENTFHIEGPCTRCQMICIDQNTGEKTTEPLRTMGKVFNGKTKFGIYLKMLKNSSVIRCDTTYLDTTGAALYGESQMREVCQVLTTNLISNPHSSKVTEDIIDKVRQRVLKHFNADPDDYSIIFTSGCTAALKIVGECFQFGDNGAFYYFANSLHTSVLGLREIVQTDKIIPVSESMLSVINMKHNGSSLFTYPAQCNYNGQKYSLKIIEKVHENPNMFVLLDAAAFLSTSKLDMSIYKPDYVALSFYKIFGTPTGLGALIISKRGAENLKKKYYGGGTVKYALAKDMNWHEKRDGISEKFEDGTPNFQGILSLHTSFKYFENLLGDEFIERISSHVFNLGKYFYHNMKSFKHYNQQPVTIFYHNSDFDDIQTQGGVVTFNLKRPDGSFVGYTEFASIAALHNIIIRTGCFCNSGACQTHLKFTTEEIMDRLHAGFICGDSNDLINDKPTGCIRVSFGYMNTKRDVDKLLKIVEFCYVQKSANVEIRESKKINFDKSKSVFELTTVNSIKNKESTEWPLSRTGLKYDREWMIINGNNGTSLTQKNEPKMCMIRPYIDESKNTLRHNFPHSNSIEVLLDDKQLEGSKCETKVCDEQIIEINCSKKQKFKFRQDFISSMEICQKCAKR